MSSSLVVAMLAPKPALLLLDLELALRLSRLHSAISASALATQASVALGRAR